jgi:hypothetical protein
MPRATWHSALSCDSRTHIEMIRGVAQHGLPYTENGEIGRFPELQARWNLVHGGKLWGTYPPLFAYVGAPFFRLGGLAAVSRMNLGFLLVFAAGAFAVSVRFLKDPLWAAAATYLTVLSTPIPATAIDMSPYVLSDALFLWATFLVISPLDAAPGKARIQALFAGILGALAVTAHLLAFPMVIGLVIAAGIPREDEGAPVIALPLSIPFSSWSPTRRSLERSASMFAGLVGGLTPVSWLNHLRFGSFNPISYGPCPWRSCAESGQDQQHIGDMLVYAGPTLLLLLVTAVTLWIFRARRPAQAAVVVATTAILVVLTPLRIHAWHLARVAIGNIVDVTWIDLGFPFYSHPDGVGQLLGPWIICSLLQCTPVIVLAPFAMRRSAPISPAARALALPGMLGLVALVLRANQPIAFSFGFPLIFLRYTTPTAAPLVILAVAILRQLRWRLVHIGAVVVLSSVAIGILIQADDTALVRRLFLLYGSLIAAAITAFSFWRSANGSEHWQRIATTAAAVCVAIGLATNIGRTFPAMEKVRSDEDARTDAIAAVVPPHSAILGFAVEIDTPLATIGTRDLQYADLYEAATWSNILPLIDSWTAEGRPVFAFLFPGSTIQRDWPDVVFDPVLPSQNVFRVRRR